MSFIELRIVFVLSARKRSSEETAGHAPPFPGPAPSVALQRAQPRGLAKKQRSRICEGNVHIQFHLLQSSAEQRIALYSASM